MAPACMPGPGRCRPLGDKDMKAGQWPKVTVGKADQGPWSLGSPPPPFSRCPQGLWATTTSQTASQGWGSRAPGEVVSAVPTVCVRRVCPVHRRLGPQGTFHPDPSTSPVWTAGPGCGSAPTGPHATPCLCPLTDRTAHPSGTGTFFCALGATGFSSPAKSALTSSATGTSLA